MPLRIERDEQHRYTLNGKRAFGVTEVLKGAMRFANVPTDVIEWASQRGTAGHRACEIIAGGQDIDEATLHESLVPRVAAFERFMVEAGYVPRRAEPYVAHETLGYCGQPDHVGHFRHMDRAHRLHVIDVKFTASIPLTVGPQTAGYAGAIAAMLGVDAGEIGRWCLHLKADGKYKLVPQRSANDWPIFCSALTLARWCHDNRIEL